MPIGETTIKKLDDLLILNLRDELKQQGHHLTGALEESLKSAVTKTGDKNILEITSLGYMNPVDEGVPASRIPYNPDVKSSAKTSKYIEGLKRYAKLRFGLSDDKEALSAAFAIAKKHAKEGMPTSGSFAFSNNSRRTLSISESYNENEEKIDELIDNGLSEEVNNFIDKTFDKTVF